MKTIRRLYFYLVAFISMEVVLWGVTPRSGLRSSNHLNGKQKEI